MRAFLLGLIAVYFGFPAGAPCASGEATSRPQYGVKIQINVRVPMRDGVTLAADIYRPDAPGRFSAILLRSYYGIDAQSLIEQAAFFAQRGYAVVLQDCRGRFDSDGRWTPYVNEPKDGFDTQEWVGRQSWCNGKIGGFGLSYNGFTQLMPAPLRSQYVKCLMPLICQQSNFGHIYNDGVMQLNMVFTFGMFASGRIMQPTRLGVANSGPGFVDYNKLFLRLPLITAVDDIVSAPHIKDWIRHDRYDDYWKAYGIKEKYGEINVPAYFVTGWYDNLLHESWRNFQGFRHSARTPEARNGTKIIAGPWAHTAGVKPGADWDVDFSSAATIDLLGLHLRWYDFWLKGLANGIDQDAPIKIFVMGANRWRSEQEWPLARTQFTNYYLSGGGKANSTYGDGALLTHDAASQSAPDRYDYDPKNPVPTLGGAISTHAPLQGPRDRRPVERRDDVLVYTSEPLAKDVEVTGPVELKLYAASSAVDTDFSATLTDVYPDGRSILICEGIRGARFRESLENPTLIAPGKIYEYTISLWETSNLFKAGHRIRVEVSSSNFPRYARNQNTDKPFGTSTDVNVAHQTIYHDAAHASRLILPVIP